MVAIFDRGEWDGTYYIAMELVEGRTLKDIVREKGPAPPEAAVDITLQILRAARYAHKHGVMHRDIKPHNVLIDEDGRVRVTDFGIARAGTSDMTETGSVMGTAQYLSPEQAQGRPVDARADLYSIGIVLYELLTGQVPFDADSPVDRGAQAGLRDAGAARRAGARDPAGARRRRAARAREGPRPALAERGRVHRRARDRAG